MAERREEADEDDDHAKGNSEGWSLVQSEPLKILEQMNNAVAIIAGRAEILAGQHDPAQVKQLRQSVQQYRELTARLWGLMERKGHRG